MASMTNTLGIFALLAAAGLQNERWHFLVLLDERSLLNPTDSATNIDGDNNVSEFNCYDDDAILH